MIIGVGKSPLAIFINKHFNFDNLYAYPKFFDEKKLLLSSKTGYIFYLKRLIKMHHYVKLALWPDYIPYKTAAKVTNLDLLHNITFIVPIHSLQDIKIGEELERQGFKVFYGYASDAKYRDYEIREFLKEVNGLKWYLGVSTKHEFHEALRFDFEGMDITGFLFGSHEDRKNREKLTLNILNLIKEVNKPQGKQSSILEFLLTNRGV